MSSPIYSPAGVILLAISALFSSCRGTGAYDDGVSAIQFSDVVVPDGMTLRNNANQSWSQEATGWRRAHYEYHGRNPIPEVCTYVKERMAQHAWILAEEEIARGQARLLFRRGKFTAEYQVHREQSATNMVVEYRTEVR